MSEMFRHCPECGGERLFGQHHPLPGGCPDTPGGECPEWACTGCGAALLAGFAVYRAESPCQAAARGEVA